jgi:hypothetical protein
VTVSGTDLKNTIDWVFKFREGVFGFSGLKITVKPNIPGELSPASLVDVRFQDGREIKPNGKYRMTTINYLLEGGEGFVKAIPPAALKSVEEFGGMREVVLKALRKNPGLLKKDRPLSGRVVAVP